LGKKQGNWGGCFAPIFWGVKRRGKTKVENAKEKGRERKQLKAVLIRCGVTEEGLQKEKLGFDRQKRKAGFQGLRPSYQRSESKYAKKEDCPS